MKKSFLLFFLLWLSSKSVVLAQYTCATAIPIIIPASGNICVNGTTVGATNGLTTYACGTSGDVVWYTYIATGATNTITITPTGAPPIQRVVVVIDGTGCADAAYNTCNASATNGGTASATWTYVVGTQIWFAVFSNNGVDGGFQACVTSVTAPPAPGSSCATAATICDKSNFSLTPFPNNSNGFQPPCFGAALQRPIFYQFTVGITGTCVWNATPLGAAEYDWAIYNITAGCNGTLVCCNYNYASAVGAPIGMAAGGPGACGTNLAGGSPPEISPPAIVTAGQTYLLIIDNYSASNVGFNFTWGGTFGMAPTASFTVAAAQGCGSATVNINNTSAGATSYSWIFGNGSTLNGANPAAQNYSPPGTYLISLVATSALGCTDVFSASVVVNPLPVADVSAFTNISCSGGANGTATGAGSSGTGPYTYSWNTVPVQNTQTATGLSAGTFVVTVRDANGCTDTASATITQPTTLLASVSASTNILCNGGNNGAATGLGNNGTGPYSYSWNTVPVQNTQVATGLTAGNYIVTVTDANGCTKTSNVNITEPTLLVASISASTNVTCSGGNNGTATGLGNNGTGPYSYSWNTVPVQNTQTATGLTAGTYTVTVTDANGCIKTATAIITETTVVVASISASTNVLCNGGNNGAATGLGNGGVVPYSYSWNTVPVQNTQTATGLTAGTYNVTVTDANGCTKTTSAIITEPTLLVASVSASTNILCNGGNNGAATGLGNNGTGPYSYSWNTTPVQNTQVATGLTAGNYIVTVTDANGCSKTSNVIITEPTLLVASVSASTNILCNGGNNGTATGLGNNGTGPYSYSWNTTPIQNTQTATGLTAGNYIVTVTDANGCTKTSNVNITEPTLLVASISASTNVTCSGGNNGTATGLGNNGTGPYSYSWNTVPVQNTQTATGLTAGTYTVTVTDANGCIKTATAIITETTVVVASISASTNVLCNGGNNGAATGLGNGGVVPYSYSWNTVPVQNTQTATGLTAGTYNVTVTDANGCTKTTSAIITEPTLLVASVSASTNILCNGGNNGAATGLGNNGTGPYSYSWNTTPVQNTQVATGLTAGNYIVTVTDANGCSKTSNVIITEPTLLVASVSASTNILCNGGNNGTATGLGNNGTGPYSYSWNTTPVQNTQVATGLTAGNYIVTVTDANGCSKTSNVIITEPTLLVASVSASTNILCNGGNNGTATGLGNNGTGPYSYSWNTTPIQNTQTATGLTAGNYIVTVTDANGCSKTSNVIITEPTLLVASVSASTNILCNGGNNGAATGLGNNGTGPYSYSWNTTPIQNTQTATGLTAGNYIVTVTDANGCSKTSNVIITEPTLLVASVSASTNILCNGGNNGSATGLGNNGTGPYSYSWNTTPIQNTQTATGLTAGNYIVTVTDANGCSKTSNVIITEPTLLVASVSASTNILCNGGNNGAATGLGNNGTGPYSYSWNTTPIQNTQTATGLIAGNYIVTVTDANGCSKTSNVIITEPTSLVASVSASTNVLCNGGNNGAATGLGNNGTGPYSYSWDTTPIQNTQTATGLTAGNYIVTVTDANGCSKTSNVIITEPTLLVASVSASTNVLCNGGNNGSATGLGTNGTSPYSYSWNTTPVQNTQTAIGLAAGNYIVTVTDANGCTKSSNVIITEPTLLVASVSASTNVLCNGGNNGSATGLGTNGTSPYSYSWNTTPVQNTQTAIGLAAGNYIVTVTDANGCTKSSNVVITQPTPVTLSVSASPTICFGQSASINATAGGGTLPYSFFWSNGNINASQTVAPATTTLYTVNVTDANGCTTAQQSVNVTVHPPLSVSSTPPNEICDGETATLTSSASGGNGGPYFYSWDNGATTANTSVSPHATTSYTVIVNDGCSTPTQTSVTVIVNPTPVVNFTPQTIDGCTPLAVSFTDLSTAPAGSSYLWTLGNGSTSTETNPFYLYTVAGTYAVSLSIVTPKNCSASATVQNVVTVHPLPVASFNTPAEEPTIYNPTVNFTNLSSGAVSWSWDFGDTLGTSTEENPTYTYHDTGTYTIQLIVQSTFGCFDTIYGTLHVSGEFTFYIPNAFTPNGDGINDSFNVYGSYYANYDMWILDRWGGKIFHSTSTAQSWDGTYFDNGSTCQNGVYVYSIKVKDEKGKAHVFVGHVALVR